MNNNKAVIKYSLHLLPSLSGAQPEPVTELHQLTVELASRGSVADSAHKGLLYLCVQVSYIYFRVCFWCIIILHAYVWKFDITSDNIGRLRWLLTLCVSMIFYYLRIAVLGRGAFAASAQSSSPAVCFCFSCHSMYYLFICELDFSYTTIALKSIIQCLKLHFV